MQSKLPEQPHAHLVFLGTDPTRQGEGLGTRLLQMTLPPLDRAGIPAYLEATTPRNRALYLRHGFVDIDTIHLPGGGQNCGECGAIQPNEDGSGRLHPVPSRPRAPST
ncbi:MAG: GNAT family N-acetyltransferase [Intrasporangium sp.]|uniref:GNAT family N-acetyltransferase n=1 Tax=Intrasporangium sp. TaxID=1925024 RepID=UPI00264890C2|nr:GNAT family N-acetyltransferase [Intrasporangium sp.]MDN5796673.1 GNAT family N-acetyltransferase [Intrasporangium sp.]